MEYLLIIILIALFLLYLIFINEKKEKEKTRQWWRKVERDVQEKKRKANLIYDIVDKELSQKVGYGALKNEELIHQLGFKISKVKKKQKREYIFTLIEDDIAEGKRKPPDQYEQERIVPELENSSNNPIGFGSKNFHIYKNHSGLIEAIKTGWSWPASFFNIFWLLWKQIYVWFAGSLLLWIVLILFGLPEPIIFSINIAYLIYFGVNGNSLYKQSLEEKGYKYSLSVNADNPQGAKAQYIEYIQNTNTEKEVLLSSTDKQE